MDTKITIKTSLGKDTRRLSIPVSDLSIDRLNEMIIKFFGENIVNNYNKVYQDPEGDEITLKNGLDLKEAVDIAIQSGTNVIRIILKPVENKNKDMPTKSFKILIDEEVSGILENHTSEQFSINNEDAISIESKHETNTSDHENINSEFRIDNSNIPDNPLSRGVNRLTDEFIYLTRKYSIENLNIPIDEIRKRISDLLDDLYGHSGERYFRSNIATESFKSFQRKFMQKSSHSSVSNITSYKSQFLTDVTLPAETKVVRNSSQKKVWRIMNNGSQPWPSGITLSNIAGDEMTFEPMPPLEKEINPEETVDIELNFTVPENTGRYISHFKLTTPDNVHFGQRIFLDIISVDDDTLSISNEKTSTLSDSNQEVLDEILCSESEELEDIEIEREENISESQEKEETGSLEDTYLVNLQQLVDMGFDDIEGNLELLKQRNNDINAVIDELLLRDYS